MTGNIRVGGNPGATGVYYQGEIALVVGMNTNPTAAEDAKIMSFLNSYGSLT